MIVTFWKGIFVADTPADDPAGRTILSKSGFKLHDKIECAVSKKFCKACRANVGNRFWTDLLESATRVRHYCNDAALKVMREHLGRLKASAAVESDIQIPVPQGLKLLPFQKAGVAYALQRKDTLIGDEMGTGKSVQSIAFVNYTKPKNVLIICPKTLVYNWKYEAERWLTEKYQIITPKNRKDAIPGGDRKLTIVTYGQIIGENPLTKSMRRVWDVMIVDEAHKLKNPQTETSQAVLGEFGLMRRSHRALFLTGTPIENYPKEIWPIAAAISPVKFGDWWEFAGRYCGLHEEPRQDGQKVWVATGSSHLAELQQKLRATFMVRRLRSQVLPELPVKRRQLIVLGDAGQKWKEHPQFKKWIDLYDKAYEQKMAALETAKTEVEYKKAAKDLEEFTGIPFTEMSEFRHVTALAKLPLCLQYIDETLEAGCDSLVIFAHHRDVLEKIKEHLGEQAVLVHGETSTTARGDAVRAFQEGKKRIFIGALKAAGAGITLTRSSTVVFFEIDWVPGVMSQAEDRLCRIGQKKMVHVIHLVLSGTLDANMVRKVIKKQEIIDKALDRSPEQVLKNQLPLKQSLG